MHAHTYRPQKYPDHTDGNIPGNVPIMYPAPRKMGGNGGEMGGKGGGGCGGDGVKQGEGGANDKNCGARVEGIGKNGTTFSIARKLVHSLLVQPVPGVRALSE